MTLHSNSTPLSTAPSSNSDEAINTSTAHERGASFARNSPRHTHTRVGMPHTLLYQTPNTPCAEMLSHLFDQRELYKQGSFPRRPGIWHLLEYMCMCCASYAGRVWLWMQSVVDSTRTSIALSRDRTRARREGQAWEATHKQHTLFWFDIRHRQSAIKRQQTCPVQHLLFASSQAQHRHQAFCISHPQSYRDSRTCMHLHFMHFPCLRLPLLTLPWHFILKTRELKSTWIWAT